jgi:hypothetical protein
MATMSEHDSNLRWSATRPNVLVVACSDGRLQEATDAFLTHQLTVKRYDRFYVPGGAGALAASGRDLLRAQQMRRECRYLIDLHGVGRVIALFHGPASDGPAEAVCADYRRKLPWASPAILRARQEQDSQELWERREEWAGRAAVHIFRCEVDARGSLAFVDLASRAAKA